MLKNECEMQRERERENGSCFMIY